MEIMQVNRQGRKKQKTKRSLLSPLWFEEGYRNNAGESARQKETENEEVVTFPHFGLRRVMEIMQVNRQGRKKQKTKRSLLFPTLV